MTNAELHKLILAMDVKLDDLAKSVHAIELGIAARGGKWAIVAKLGLFIAGTASTIAAALILGKL